VRRHDQGTTLKKKIIAALALALAMAGAHAQSSVTLYGIIDLGVDYANNVANGVNGNLVPGTGSKLVQMQSGVPAGTRWGVDHGLLSVGHAKPGRHPRGHQAYVLKPYAPAMPALC
jgi:Gram-negative porin